MSQNPRPIQAQRWIARWGPLAAVAMLCVAGPVQAQQVVAAKRSKVYHIYPDDCSAAQKISEANKIEYGSAEEAEREGRRLCKMCATIRARNEKKKDGPTPRKPPKNKKKKAGQSSDAKKVAYREPDELPMPSAPRTSVRVKKVLPGGTLVLDDGQRVTLLGIRLPGEGQPLADKAVSLLQKKARGPKVWIRSPQGEDGLARRDRLGRLVVLMECGETDVAVELLSAGLAWVDGTLAAHASELYEKKMDDAAWAQRGIWKRLDGPAGQIKVVVGKHTREYHLPDCPHVVHLSAPATITLNEAKGRRLAPCTLFREDSPHK